MTETLINYVFTKRNHRWNLKGERVGIIPTETEITEALDEAARVLYDEPVGSRLEVGGLVIVKRPRTHDVYVYVGDYQ